MKNQITKINQTLRSSGWMSALTGLGLLLAVAAPVLADNDHQNASRVFPPQSHPYGASYPEWAARYWQWRISFPNSVDPGNGTVPLESLQSGKVWFLPPGPNHQAVTRQITVPEGNAFFFPVASVYVDNSVYADNPTCSSNPPPLPVEGMNGLLASANDQWTSATLTAAKIDGVAVGGLENPQTTQYRLQNVFFVTVADHDNLLTGDCIPDGGTLPLVTVGAFMMVMPLSVGIHHINIVGKAGTLAEPGKYLDKDITYEITVKDDGNEKER